VVLLGDEANASIGIGEHHDIDQPELQEDLDEFRRICKRYSRSQGFLWERFWLERWFLIRNFMRREKLRGCLAIDSDVLLFCNVPEESLRFRSYAMTFGRWDAVRVVPHCNFIGSPVSMPALSWTDEVVDQGTLQLPALESIFC
jgi:hypothetical protein